MSDSLVYRYDKAGNVTEFINRRGQTISFVLDSLGRVVTRTADAAVTNYAYGNPAWPWIAAWNSESADTIYYDERGRVTSEVTRFGTQRYAIISKYRKQGPRDSLIVNGPGSSTRFVKYSYNAALQLDSVIQLVSGVRKKTTIRYNKDGLPWKVLLPTTTPVENTILYTGDHQIDRSDWSPSALYDKLGSQNTYFSGRLFSRTSAGMTSSRRVGFNASNELTGYLDETYETVWECSDPEDPGTCYPRTVTVPGDSISYGV